MSPEFVAAVPAIDLEWPVFSEARASLVAFVPDTFPFKPAPDAVEGEFLSLLQDADPVERLWDRVRQYLDRVTTRLQEMGTRDDELARLFICAIEVRGEMKQHPVFGALDESGDRLFALP